MINIEQLSLWWKTFHIEGLPTEIRLVNTKINKLTASGYYMNFENVVRDINTYDIRDQWQMYFILNDINPACYDKPQHEKIIERPSSTTQATDVLARRWVFIDLDPKRTKDTGSTEEQLTAAKKKANEIYTYLKKQGFDSIVCAMSGNGTHLLVPCAMKNCEETNTLVENFLKVLQMLFEDDVIDVDQKPSDPCRLCKIYGTTAKKGANTKERPHRLSYISKLPDEIKPNDKAYFQKVADLLPPPPPKYSKDRNFGDGDFDVEDFLVKHGLEYHKKEISSGTRYLLEECPFNGDHKHGEAMVFKYHDGALQFSCFHNSCSQYHWREFRLRFDPEAYDKKEYRDYEFKRQHNMMKYQVKEPPQPLKEDNEKGPIWLKMSEIKRPKFNIANYIPSGIEQVDRLTVGFRRKHVTVWSGYRGSAKTTVLNMLILNAAQRGYKTALWTGELDGEEEKNWLYLQAAGKTYNRMTSVQDFYETPDDICEKIDPWIDGHMRIFNNKYGSDFQQIIDKVRELKKEWDLDVAIFDNLMTLDIDGLEGDKNERQKKLMIVLTDLAKENDMHIHIVAHPNKSGNFLRMNNISGTGNIPDLAQNVMILHRINQDFVMNAREFLPNSTIQEILDSKCTNCIEICKWRDKGSAVDHFIKLYFERESNRLKNSPADNVHYNWEEHYEEYTVPEEPQPLPTTIQPNQSFNTPIETLYTQKEDNAYWGQFRNDTDNYPF